jgi:oxazoline/thiazoline dehydrogenase
MFQEGFLEAEDTAGDGEASVGSSDAPVLDEWEFHDLLFHVRSREGRRREPYGATYRFEGVREPLPAVKEPPDGERVALHRPDLGALRQHDVPFAEVVESRRSWRRPGPVPLSVDQLGDLLYRAARVRGRRPTEHEEVSSRPYPGGGADYELEVYPVVHRVEGLAAGLYHYDPLGHALALMAPGSPLVERFVAHTARKAALPDSVLPDVVLAVTARVQRLTYKYQSIVYAVALRDLGVLYQTFYLTATAMDLAPCAIGGGDSELFAAISGLSRFAEPHIGEFLLSSRDRGET